MKVPSKHAVLGIVFSLAALPFLSCSLGLNGGSGGIAVSIAIPRSIGSSALPTALRKAFAPSASSRFIHPGTRLVEVSIDLDGGGESIRAQSAVAEGESSASVTVRDVPYGTHQLTVSLYDAAGNLLSRGSTSVSVESRELATATVTAVPVTEKTFLPGPYGSRGTLIPPENYGTLCVYRVAVPNTGPYGVRYIDSGASREPLDPGILALYGADGRLIPFDSGDMHTAYAAIPAGDCYVVVDAPSAALGDLELSLDADLRVTMSAPTLSIYPARTVQDRTRPFTLLIPSGFTGEYAISFGNANGAACAFSATSSTELLVRPGADGLTSWMNPDTSARITFTDALLGLQRTNVSFIFAGAPLTFIYDPEVVPSDSSASTIPTIGDIVAKVNDLREEYKTVIVALREGKAYDGGARIDISYGISLLGGFSPGGIRENVHGASKITFSSNDDAIGFWENASGSLLDSLDIVLEGESLNAGSSGIVTDSKIGLKNVSLSYSKEIPLASDVFFDYSLIRAGNGDITLDACSILGPRISFGGTGNYAINGIAFTVESGALRVSNSLVDSCTVSAKTTGGLVTLSGIYAPDFDSGDITIAGSAVSSGLIARSASAPVAMLSLNLRGTGGLNVANSLLVTDYPSGSESLFIHYAGDADDLRLNHCVLGYAGTIVGETYLIRYSLSGLTFGNWARSSYSSNPVMSLRELSLASTDPSRAGFLKPQASSPEILRSGGADLSSAKARSDAFVTAIDPPDLLRDRTGRARTGNGTTGFSVGAYEVD